MKVMQVSPQRTTSEIKNFVLSPYFGDGLRITFGVLLPSLILFKFNLLNVGITISLGAVCASVPDTPGPILHRRNAMLISTSLVSVVSLLIGLGNWSPYILGILIVGFSFLFSMFYVYGARAASVGTAALLVMTLGIGDVRPILDIFLYSLSILAGGLWYTALSLSLYEIMPYRLAQQSLGDSIVEVARFMRIKAGFYGDRISYEDNFNKLIEVQIVVNEKQDAVREMLFKSREIVRESTQEGRFLLLVFVDMVDLFEQIMSTFYNYKNLHEQFDEAGILKKYEAILLQLAHQLEDTGYALKVGTIPHISPNLPRKIQELKQAISDLENGPDAEKYSPISIGALKNIEVNIENIFVRIKKIKGSFKVRKQRLLGKNELETSPFITHQDYDVKLFKENLSLSSQIFRHSMRVGIVMLLGFIIAQSYPFLHSNWILLTIMVIMKPGFSLTKERNYHRLIGTVAGAVVGMLILKWVEDKQALFAILLFCMLGAYSFQRKYYIVSVLFMTPFILILYDFLGMGSRAILIERVYDTLIGGGIAFIANYFLLPNWEHEKLRSVLTEMLSANLNYYRQVSGLYFGNAYERTPYKMARKDVFVKSANLASAFQRMFSEPKSKQNSIKEVHKFSVLNHLLSSYIATLVLYAKEHFDSIPDLEELKLIAENTEHLLEEAIKVLEHDEQVEPENIRLIKIRHQYDFEEEGAILIPEQFINIQKVALDIYKISEKIKV